jgi:hypothetical protein
MGLAWQEALKRAGAGSQKPGSKDADDSDDEGRMMTRTQQTVRKKKKQSRRAKEGQRRRGQGAVDLHSGAVQLPVQPQCSASDPRLLLHRAEARYSGQTCAARSAPVTLLSEQHRAAAVGAASLSTPWRVDAAI